MKLWMVYTARALALLWAGFWIFFFVGSVLVPGPIAVHVILVGAAPLLLFLILALIPWRWELIGGLLLLVMSVIIGAIYAIGSAAIVRREGSGLPMAIRLITTIAFSGPPLVAGILFLLHHRLLTSRTEVESPLNG